MGQKRAVKVNSELLQFYWGMGQDIVDKQKMAKLSDGFLKQLSIDLLPQKQKIVMKPSFMSKKPYKTTDQDPF